MEEEKKRLGNKRGRKNEDENDLNWYKDKY